MHRQALDTIVSAYFSKWETSEVLRKLQAAKIANTKPNSFASLPSHPILRNVQVVLGEQKIDMAALPVQTDFSCLIKLQD